MAKPSGIVNIRGRDYETVASRVQRFRDDHPDWSLESEILVRDADCVVVRSTVKNETGRILATGHAEEFRKASAINRTSATENAETSAHGRCLGALGYGGTEFASADEVAASIKQQATSGIHKPTDGAMDSLDEMQQKHVLDVVTLVTDALNDNDDVAAYHACELLKDADEKVAAWSYLDSKQRKRIKAAGESLKEAKNAA